MPAASFLPWDQEHLLPEAGPTNGWDWRSTTLSEFIAALRRFDALDGAA